MTKPGPIGVSMSVTGDEVAADAALLERLGYTTIWLPGGQLSTLDPIGRVLRATERVAVGSAIIPAGVHDARTVAATFAGLEAAHPGRFVVGIGGVQQPRQLAALHAYLDQLDSAATPVPSARRMLAALGPRKLALARDRTAGALPLLVTPEYTAGARAVLGADSTLVVHQCVVLDRDADRARAVARGPLSFLAGVRGYPANLRNMGFTDEDIAGLSDRLVDAVVAWGDVAAIRARVAAHQAAGADQVTLSVLHDAEPANPRAAWRELADALIPARRRR